MSEREDVAAIILEHIWGKEYPSDEADCCADALLASSWLAVHDERVRADERVRLAGEVEALVAEARTWHVYQSRDTGDVHPADSVRDLLNDIEAALVRDDLPVWHRTEDNQ